MVVLLEMIGNNCLNFSQKCLFLTIEAPPRKKTKTHYKLVVGNHVPVRRAACLLKSSPTHLLNSLKGSLPTVKTDSCLKNPVNPILMFGVIGTWWHPFSSLAAETDALAEQVPGKINIESIVISIDDFFNRYPFFVASLAVVWLVVIPLTQEYTKKFKYVSAFDGYLKLKDDPSAQLLDIRKKQSLIQLGAPHLKSLSKQAVYVEFSENEDGFVKEVLKNFNDPGNTVLCIVDNFDGNSLKAAELLFESGFKEAYAIKGGLRGKKGWQEIQETLLPPSLHIYPRKKSQQFDVNGEKTNKVEDAKGSISSSKSISQDEIPRAENGYVKPVDTPVQVKLTSDRPSSPYPNYPDFKPPSSPTPSKPVK